MAANATFVRCPYNVNHNVSIYRIQYHLMKCKKNYPEADFAICPFSASHHIPRIDIDSHVKKCPNRQIREEFSNKDFQDPDQDLYARHIVYGSSLIPYEGDPDFPESFTKSDKTSPSSRVSISGLGRGCILKRDKAEAFILHHKSRSEFSCENSSLKKEACGSTGRCETKLDNTLLEGGFEAYPNSFRTFPQNSKQKQDYNKYSKNKEEGSDLSSPPTTHSTSSNYATISESKQKSTTPAQSSSPNLVAMKISLCDLPSSKLVGLGRSQLIQIAQEKRINSSKKSQ